MGLTGNSSHRFIRAEGEKVEIFMTHNYDRGNYQNRYRLNRGLRRIQFSGKSRGKPRYEQNYRTGNFRGNMRIHQNFGRQNNREEYRSNNRNDDYRRERGTSRF